jgi:hypothetical protein
MKYFVLPHKQGAFWQLYKVKTHLRMGIMKRALMNISREKIKRNLLEDYRMEKSIFLHRALSYHYAT